jgi:hypothetical protein
MLQRLRNVILWSSLATIVWPTGSEIAYADQAAGQPAGQSSQPATGNQQSPEAQQNTDGAEIADNEPAGNQSEQAENEGRIIADADAEQNSRGRFIPTEQISQDLGVSFPVDI